MTNNIQVEKTIICEAVDCNNDATERIKINIQKNSYISFQLCSNCKHQFFE